MLAAGRVLLRDSTWRGNVELHTLMEVVTTLLALMVGVVGLIRFYVKKLNIFLFIGAGFLGTAFLDGYHAVATSNWFRENFPSPLPSLIPWSWFASRIFLAVFLCFSWYFWRRGKTWGERGRVNEQTVYLFAALFALSTLFFFAFVPLPRAYYPELVFHRPQEHVAALCFLLAFIGYWRNGRWKNDIFEYCLMLALIGGFMSQSMFMSFSGGNFDAMFDAAHLLKIVSYIVVLIGLLVSLYTLLWQAEENLVRISQGKEALEQENEQRRQAEGGLRKLMDETGEAVRVLATSAVEIMASTSQLTTTATATAVAVRETTTTVEEVRQTAEVASQKAQFVFDSAQKAAQISRSGRKSTEDVAAGMTRIRQQMDAIAASMGRLSEQSQAIGQIIATVEDLSAQSNLLAVNAAIEAAKAGEHGKGFGVVAQEVKSLAVQSRQATNEVRTILSDIRKATTTAVLATEQGSKAVDAGTRHTDLAAQSIQTLAGSVSEAAQAATQIAASSQQQLVGVDQVAAAMASITQASGQNVADATQLETAARNINDLGQRLRQMVERYKV